MKFLLYLLSLFSFINVVMTMVYFIRTVDGMLRKLLIVFFATLAWSLLPFLLDIDKIWQFPKIASVFPLTIGSTMLVVYLYKFRIKKRDPEVEKAKEVVEKAKEVVEKTEQAVVIAKEAVVIAKEVVKDKDNTSPLKEQNG